MEQIRLLRRLWTRLIATGCVCDKTCQHDCAEKSLTLLQNVRDLAHTEDEIFIRAARYSHSRHVGMYYYKETSTKLDWSTFEALRYINREDWIGVSKCRLHNACWVACEIQEALKCLLRSCMESRKTESSTISQRNVCHGRCCYRDIAALEFGSRIFSRLV